MLFTPSLLVLLHLMVSQIPLVNSQYLDCGSDPKFNNLPDNWAEQNTDQFLAEELQRAQQAKLHLTESMVQRYAPGVDMFNCSPDNQCVIPSCHVMDANEENAPAAYMSLIALAHLNDVHRMYWEGLKRAQVTFNSLTAKYVNAFSAAGMRAEFDPTTSQLITTGIALSLTLAAMFRADKIAAHLTQKGIFPAVKEGVAAHKYEIVNIGRNAVPVLTSSISTVVASGAFPGHMSAFFNIWVQTREGSFGPVADFGNLLDYVIRTAKTVVFNDNALLLAGQADGSGEYVTKYLTDGQLTLSPIDSSTQIAQFVENQLGATMLNALWIKNNVYIVANPLLDGVSCEDDRRGPQVVKFCREGDPHVYYMYWPLLAAGKAGFAWSSVKYPPGHDQLNDFSQQFSLKTIMEHSVATFWLDPTMLKPQIIGTLAAASNILLGENRNLLITDELGRPVLAPMSFSIPICYLGPIVGENAMWDSDTTGKWPTEWKVGPGRGIPFIREQYFRSKFAPYPCRCGPRGRDTEAFRERSGLKNANKYLAWCQSWYRIKVGVHSGWDDMELQVPDVWKQDLDRYAPTLQKFFDVSNGKNTPPSTDGQNPNPNESNIPPYSGQSPNSEFPPTQAPNDPNSPPGSDQPIDQQTQPGFPLGIEKGTRPPRSDRREGDFWNRQGPGPAPGAQSASPDEQKNREQYGAVPGAGVPNRPQEAS